MWAVDEAMEHHRQMGLDLIDEVAEVFGREALGDHEVQVFPQD
jgi:hypothetical protein